MDFISLFENLGVTAAMLCFFVWYTVRRDKEFAEQRKFHAENEKEQRNKHSEIEKMNLERYAELQRDTTKVIADFNSRLASLENVIKEITGK